MYLSIDVHVIVIDTVIDRSIWAREYKTRGVEKYWERNEGSVWLVPIEIVEALSTSLIRSKWWRNVKEKWNDLNWAYRKCHVVVNNFAYHCVSTCVVWSCIAFHAVMGRTGKWRTGTKNRMGWRTLSDIILENQRSLLPPNFSSEYVARLLIDYESIGLKIRLK